MSRADDLRAELREVLDALEVRKTTVADVRWCPQKPTARQQEFLDLDADDALYGGAAGGGKSSALLMGALRWVDVPKYSALIIRRTYRDLALPGAIMDRAGDWLRPTAAKWAEIDKAWTFPSGARLSFGFMEIEADKFRYAGAEYQFIGTDEATQFSKTQYRYLRTRLRRNAGFPVPPHSRCASNPGGEGHEWCFERFVDHSNGPPPFPFVPAFAVDNPHLDVEDYVMRLEDLDEVTKAQLLHGAWILDAQGLIYPFNEAHLVPDAPVLDDDWRFVLGVDLGASLERPTTAFSVAGWHPRIPEGTWILECHKHAGLGVTDIAHRIEDLRRKYAGFNRIVVDEGALGVAYGHEFRSRHALATTAAAKRDKPGFRKLMRSAIERGRIQIVEPFCKDLVEEAKKLRFDETGLKEPKKADNHCTDASLYAWRECRSYTAKSPKRFVRPGSSSWFARWEQESIEAERHEVEAEKQRERRWFQ